MTVTIEFQQEKLDGTAAARIVLAVKRALSTDPSRAIKGPELRLRPWGGGGGPIVDDDGTVIGNWKVEKTKKKEAA